MNTTPPTELMQQAQRIVVKIGTNTLCGSAARPDRKFIESLAFQVSTLKKRGLEVSLVVSGAIGAGLAELDMDQRPCDVSHLQAIAAIGQGQLMRLFHDVFADFGLTVAQVLVTRDAFEDRRRYLNVRNTLTTLGEYGAVAIINENDTVAVDEIRFGENDVLAAHVANLQAADALVLLTNVDGVLKDGEVVDIIEKVDDDAMKLVCDSKSSLGSGGMATKLTAAGMVARAGGLTVITRGAAENVLIRLADGEKLGTAFVPAKDRMPGRRVWIAQASRVEGKLFVDGGAVRAIVQRGKSLLPSGILNVSGGFGEGATLDIVDVQTGESIARGMTNYSSEAIEKIAGLQSDDIAGVLGDRPYVEVIHRDNMTVEKK